MSEQIRAAIKHFQNTYKQLGTSGLSRTNFISSDHVARVPWNEAGIKDNEFEHSIYTKYANHLSKLGIGASTLEHHNGIPILKVPKYKLNDDKYHEIHKMFEKRLGHPIGVGMSRKAYEHTNVVFKVPYQDRGAIDNLKEHELFHRTGHLKNPHSFAHNRLLWVNHVPVLAMEKVNRDESGYAPDKFNTQDYDWNQAGRNKKGKWKAYDYATFTPKD